MKQSLVRGAVFYGTTIGMGLSAMLFQIQAMKIGYDAKGLFVWSTTEELGVMVVCAAFLVALASMSNCASTRKTKYRDLFPQCWLRGGAMALAGVMLMLSILYSLEPVPILLRIFGMLSAVCMAAGGVFLASGYRPHYVIHGTVCVYFLIRLLASYRVWGASPHLERYAFSLIADVLLMLYAFHRCAADAGIYSRKRMILTGFSGIFVSLIAMANSTDWVFYLTAVIWICASMCTLGEDRNIPAR